MTHTTHSDEAIVKELYNKDPYRYRNIPNSKNNWEYEDGLKNVREALSQARADQDRIARAEFTKKAHQIILEALGEASALFMSQECKGTEIIVPTEDLLHIADTALKALTNQYNNTV